MKAHLIDGSPGLFLVITMFPAEAKSLLGISGDLKNKAKVKTMSEFERILKEALEGAAVVN